MDALLIHRLHFAFTITFHYFFPQLTMGLAPPRCLREIFVWPVRQTDLAVSLHDRA